MLMRRSQLLTDNKIIALIPNMTSNTSPYGVVSCGSYLSSQSNREPWHAFNDDDHTWHGDVGRTNWIAYKFNKPVHLVYVTRYNSTNMLYTVQVSNDGSNYINATATNINVQSVELTLISKNKKYQWIRWSIYSNYVAGSSYYCYADSLQAYGWI